MKETTPQLVIDAHAIIGESPVWSADEDALYWADIKGHALHRTDHASGETRSWSVPSDFGGYALMPGGGGAVVALRTGIFMLDLGDGSLAHLADPPFDPHTHRFNESGIDPAGRLWIGEMFDPEPGVKARPTAGRLHSFTLAGGLVTHDVEVHTANGFAWSEDGRTFMLAHSHDCYIEAIAFDVEGAHLNERRMFARIDRSVGQPDGGTFDAEGYYWCAIHHGGRLYRYAPDGSIDRKVAVPVSNPTMPAFAGPDLRTIYFTSATHGKMDVPVHEGGLFRFQSDVPGRQLTAFGG